MMANRLESASRVIRPSVGAEVHSGLNAASVTNRPTRRTVLATLATGVTLSALPSLSWAAPSPDFVAPADRIFSVIYKDKRIGAHAVSFSKTTGETRVATEIDLKVKALFLTVFAFSHRSEEVWRDGRLLSLNSETVEHGETLRVSGAATPKGFRLVGNAGPYTASAGALTSNSLWSPAVLDQDFVIDAQHGGVIGVSVRKLADEDLMILGRKVRTTRYRFLTPFLGGDIWYDETDQWVRGEFEQDGAQIDYRLEG